MSGHGNGTACPCSDAAVQENPLQDAPASNSNDLTKALSWWSEKKKRTTTGLPSDGIAAATNAPQQQPQHNTSVSEADGAADVRGDVPAAADDDDDDDDWVHVSIPPPRPPFSSTRCCRLKKKLHSAL